MTRCRADPAELLDRAEELFDEYRFTEARAAWQRFDELAPPSRRSPLAARRVEGRGRMAGDDQDPEQAEAAFREAAAELPASSATSWPRWSPRPARVPRPGRVPRSGRRRSWLELTAVTERIVAIGDADAPAPGRDCGWSMPLLALDRLDDALAAVDAAHRRAAGPGRRCGPRWPRRRARCLLVLERFEEARDGCRRLPGAVWPAR